MTAVLRQEDFDDLHEFITTQIAAGYVATPDILDDAAELFAEVVPDRAALRDAASVIAGRAVQAHFEEQATWPATTDCDRLDAAFAELVGAGIVARQHFSCCGTCGAEEIRTELQQAKKAGLAVRGFTFFHTQDTAHAIAGDLLYLSYGTANTDKAAAIAIGHEVVATLDRHGLCPQWNGKPAHRIALPLHWQRRRPRPA
jgi:hypothetical protein